VYEIMNIFAIGCPILGRILTLAFKALRPPPHPDTSVKPALTYFAIRFFAVMPGFCQHSDASSRAT
jgi:hypothetical protein